MLFRSLVARDRILAHLDRKGFNIVSFSGIRKYVDDQYTDVFLREVQRNYHEDLRKATTKHGEHALARP